MGMAASQARLLCITARIHDVEYQAQSIQNAKLQLATQEDRVYQEYNDALNATMLTATAFKDGEKYTVAATFDNLFSRNRVTMANGDEYALFNDKGLMVVEQSVFDAYNEMKNKGIDDPYLFAIHMALGEYSEAWARSVRGNNSGDIVSDPETMQKAEEAVYTANSNDKDLKDLHETLKKLTKNDNIYDRENVDENELEKYDETLANYRSKLYEKNAEEIARNAAEVPEDENKFKEYKFNNDNFAYYLKLFKQIESAGGCVPISEYNGSFGNAATNNEWLQGMIESGQFTIEKWTEKNGDGNFDSISVGADSCLAYTEASTIDNTALAKAEAKYEHDMRQIDKKDKEYDLTLSKLETERQALTTEYDSVKKVIEDNVDRTFGIFS